MGDARRAELPALVVLVVDAAAALGFGLTYSALLGFLLVTSSEAELAETYPTGSQAAIALFCLTVAIAVVGAATAIVAVQFRRGARLGRVGAVALLGTVTVATMLAAFVAHGGFDRSRSPRWLLVALVHGGAAAALRRPT